MYFKAYTLLSDIFSKLTELNSYLQEMCGDKFSVHDKLQAFIK